MKVEVIRGATTYTLSDPSDPSVPFALETIDLGGASVRNIEESGPYQDGATHLDERLEPETITLRINVRGVSASALDGHRDTLNAMFKPIKGVPITLRYTRDDSEVRQIDTRRTGRLAIPLVRENRPGNLHRAVVQLRAADPTWYNPDEETDTFLAPVGDWWLAYSTIGTANVLTHVENPSQGQLWDNAGSVAAGSPFTVAFRSGSVAPVGGSILESFSVHSSNFINFRANGFFDAHFWQAGSVSAGAFSMAGGTQNYFLVSSGTAASLYIDGELFNAAVGVTPDIPGSAAAGGQTRWRSSYTNASDTYWPEPLPYAAVYNIALNTSQRNSLSAAMDDAATFGSAYSAPIAYVGDVDTYPIISIVGPLADPIITNTTTGDTLNFTGGTVGTAEIWVIDTRYGRKSALSGTTSVVNYLSNDSDLSTFRIVPAPIATGGTNVITVQSTNAGTAASVTLTYYNRYLSY